MIEPSSHIIKAEERISDALQRMNALQDRAILLLVTDEQERIIGTLSDGDIRRYLTGGADLNGKVSQAMKADFIFLREGDSEWEKLKGLDPQEKKLIPVLDKDHRLIRLLDLRDYKPTLPVSAFIMAGGRGVRLAPLTDNTPKPLLPVGDQPILGHLLEHLDAQGIQDITLSTRYLSNLIDEYVLGLDRPGIEVLREQEALGTAGSLRLKPEWNNPTVLLMNSDLLTDLDIQEMYGRFEEGELDMLIASIPYHVSVPYAVLETADGLIQGLSEKPRYTYQSNAGIYMFSRELLELIPDNGRFDATELIEQAIGSNKKVGFHPIRTYWLDIGRHADYERAQIDIQKLFK